MKHQNTIFVITLITSIGLVVAGFLVPPMGIIDGSVLTAVGELFGFGALAQLPHVVAMGKEFRIKHGQTSISVGDHDDLEENEENC